MCLTTPWDTRQDLKNWSTATGSFIATCKTASVTARCQPARGKPQLGKPKKAKFLRFAAGRGRSKRWYTARQVTIPARPFLPEGELPAKWRVRFEKIAGLVVTRLVMRRAS